MKDEIITTIQELPPISELKCSTCAFWKKIEGTEEGSCCEKPPVVVTEHVNIYPDSPIPHHILMGVTRFPTTTADTFCGHHSDNEEELL